VPEKRGLREAALGPIVGVNPPMSKPAVKKRLKVVAKLFTAALYIAAGFASGIMLTRRFKLF
jgi:hypothetical protein